MSVRIGSGVGIGDGDTPPALARRVDRQWSGRPIFVPRPHIVVGVAVRPAVHRDRLDVACRIESARPEGATEQIANLALVVFEGQRGQATATSRALLALRTPVADDRYL